MSDYDVPSQFVDEVHNEENFDDLLDLDIFGDDKFGADFGGEQDLNLPEESTNQQDVAPSAAPVVQDQHQEVPSNANDGLRVLEQLPNIDFDDSNSEWLNLVNTDADLDIDDILGISAQEGQQSHVITPGEDFKETTHGLTPVTPHQNAVGRVGPNNLQLGSSARTTAARHPLAEEHADIDEHYFTESDGESGSSGVSDDPEYETYQENDPLIIPDPVLEGWGRTGKRIEQEVWFNPETSRWQPSASHHDMRATLIVRAQAEYPDDRYLYPDPTDELEHGETAFFKPHQNRGPDRDHCADELFEWREYQSKRDENGKPLKTNKPNVTVEHPGFMFEGDKILLDPRNNPVVNHKFIPLTLSAYTDGSKLQEMALKPGCRQVDLWARMPRWEQKTDKSGRTTTISLRGKNTRINMPMTRFREKKGTIAGSDREGTDVIMAGLRRFYHHHGFDPVAAGNSVKSFGRDLEPWEVKQVRLGNVSQFGARAGHRALDQATRDAKMQKTLKAIEKGKKRQAAKEGKRSREDDDADSESPGADARKRRRRGREVDAGHATFDEGYNTHRAGLVNASQGSAYHRQGGYAPALGPPQVQYCAYGPPGATYHAPPMPVQYPSNFNQHGSITGNLPTFAPNRTQQAPHGGVHMQATTSPYVTVQAPAPLSNSLLNSAYYPEDQFPRFNTGVQSFGPREPQQTPRRSDQVLRDVNNTRPSAESRSQRYLQDFDDVTRPAGNTLAPGGHGVQQAPKQVLGKRRQRDAPRFGEEHEGTANTGRGVSSAISRSYGAGDPNIPRPTGRQHLDGQANLGLDLDSAHKRRRNNQNPDTEPRQQRQRHPERAPRPTHYGAVGAPIPLMPPAEVVGAAQPGSNPLGYAEEPLKSPGTISRELGDIFQVPNPMATWNGNSNQGANNPRQHEPRQVLGKHRREDPMGRWGEDVYVPHQNLGQQGPEDDFGTLGEDADVPAPKRRRMPTTEGYHAPPVQAPPAQPMRKSRRRERDAQLPSWQPHAHQPIPYSQQTPQVLGAVNTSQRNIYTSNTPASVGGVAQGFHPLGHNLPQLSMLPQVHTQAPTDIRDVRPSNGDESQSLDSALRYTREAFREWTGQEAPVTNLEDSYNVQYREIRSAFRAWWRSEENPHRGEQLPELWRALRWTGGMDDWDAPENGEHLREARRRGKKAA